MLYADLHRKFANDAKESERSEDVLTSNVFGTLFVAGAWKILGTWLAAARPYGPSGPVQPDLAGPSDYWFWPRLGLTEPDVVIRLGDMLVIVEAKYDSKKSGKAAPAGDDAEPIDTKDQLAREWRSCASGVETGGYPETLAAAIAACPRRALVYLVQRGRRVGSWDELAASALEIPSDAALYLLTWEDLDDVLVGHAQLRWVRDLRRYLGRRRLSTFRGFTTAFTLYASADLRGWQRRRSSPPAIWTAFPRERLALLAKLAARGARSGARPATWRRAVAPAGLPGLAALARRPPRFPRPEHQDG